MGRMISVTAIALFLAACASAPEQAPATQATAEQATAEQAAKAPRSCKSEASAVFDATEAEVLVHGDYDAYWALVTQRRAMIEACEAERAAAQAPESTELAPAIETKPAPAPHPPALSERQAARQACEDDAEAFLTSEAGDALAHGDFSEYRTFRERKADLVEKCMRDGGWTE